MAYLETPPDRFLFRISECRLRAGAGPRRRPSQLATAEVTPADGLGQAVRRRRSGPFSAIPGVSRKASTISSELDREIEGTPTQTGFGRILAGFSHH